MHRNLILQTELILCPVCQRIFDFESLICSVTLGRNMLLGIDTHFRKMLQGVMKAVIMVCCLLLASSAVFASPGPLPNLQFCGWSKLYHRSSMQFIRLCTAQCRLE